jgi:hypothetical protein
MVSTRKEERAMKVRHWVACLGAASVVLMGATGSRARAADEWYVLGEKTLKSSDPSTELKSKGDRWEHDVKRIKISIQGADVEIAKIVLHWDGRPDDTISNVGVLKSGGETAPKDAPGHKARLASVVVQYKILGGATTATLKLWGFD